MKFNIQKTPISDLLIIKPNVYEDKRGFFLETYNKNEFKELGLNLDFVQDNHSKSKKGVLRGLHFQTQFPQGKLVRVTNGSVWDVAVDLRKDSETYKKWFGIELNEKNKLMFYVPEGFAHGFLTLEDDTEFQYKCTNFYHAEYDSGLIWNDESLNIEWPFNIYDIDINQVIISEKDKKLQNFIDYDAEK